MPSCSISPTNRREAAAKRCAPSELGVSVGCDSLQVLRVKAAATVPNEPICQPLSSVPWPFFSVFTFFLCHTIAVFPTPDADDDVAPVRVQHVLAWRDRLPRSGRRRIEHSQLSSPSAHSPARFEHLAGHGQSEIAEMTVVAGDRRRNPSVPILRCKAALRRPTTAHPRAHQSVKIFLAASHTVARRLRETWDRPLTMEIPASSLGKGDPQVAQYSTVQTVPTASRSRLRHLALLCDHADIAPRSIFSFPLPLPLPLLSIDLLPGIWNEPWCPPSPPPPLPPSPFVRPGRWVLRDRLRFGFRFPRFRSFATLSPPCRRDSPPSPSSPPLATTVIFFHPTS